jgi:phosphatidylglycerophosphatase A
MTRLDRAAIWLATAGGIGLAPKAPGTFGSLPGLVVGAAFYQGARAALPGAAPAVHHAVVAVALALSTLFALWTIHVAERAWQTHDDQRIVIDEVVGQAIAVGFVAPAWWTLLLGFALFRLLDITKPLVIGWVDEHGPGAVGTLFDDVLAGMGAAAALVALCALS